MTEILDNLLWQCGIDELPNELKIARPFAVFNMCHAADFFPRERALLNPQGVAMYTHWAIDDGPTLPHVVMLHSLVDQVVNILRAHQPVIVHCAQGLNRSGLVTALAIRRYLGVSGQEAADILMERRRMALCNPRFYEYVTSLEAPLNNDPRLQRVSPTRTPQTSNRSKTSKVAARLPAE